MRRTLQRAVGAGRGGGPLFHSSTSASKSPYNSPSSAKSNYNPLSLSSSISSFNHPLSSSSTIPAFPPCILSPTISEDCDGEFVTGSGDDGIGFSNRCDNASVFGPVPSMDEVENAVYALQQVVDPTHFPQFLEDNRTFDLESDEAQETASPTRLLSEVSSVGSEFDWVEPSLQLCYPRIPLHSGSFRVYGAFHLLQSDPSVQRMVISLSSDKAIWDAILNNEAVRDFRESLIEAGNKVHNIRDDSSDEPEPATNFFTWIFENTKVKVMEIIEKIVELVHRLFALPDGEMMVKGPAAERVDEKLRIPLMLSVMVLFIVFVTRARWA